MATSPLYIQQKHTIGLLYHLFQPNHECDTILELDSIGFNNIKNCLVLNMRKI